MNTTQSDFQQAIDTGIIDGNRLSALRELDDGSSSFVMMLIEDFRSQQESVFSVLASSLRKQDLAAVGRDAHKLKSSLANIGAGRAAPHAFRNTLERATQKTPTESRLEAA